MVPFPPRAVFLLGLAVVTLCCPACAGGKRFYPVHGRVLVDGKPAEGVTIVFQPVEHSESSLQPTAVVEADGSFKVRTFLLEERVVKEGAPAGEYLVACVWYPPDLEKYAGRAVLPDKLGHKYDVAKTSGLRAVVREEPTELPPFKLVTAEK